MVGSSKSDIVRISQQLFFDCPLIGIGSILVGKITENKIVEIRQKSQKVEKVRKYEQYDTAEEVCFVNLRLK